MCESTSVRAPARSARAATSTGGANSASPSATSFASRDLSAIHDGNLYAVDLDTGKRKFAFHTGDKIRSSPALAKGRCFVGSEDGHLYCIDAKTGDPYWSFDAKGGIDASPTVVGETVTMDAPVAAGGVLRMVTESQSCGLGE